MMILKSFILSFFIIITLVSSSFAAAHCESSIPMMELGDSDKKQESLYSEDDQRIKRDIDDHIIHERLLSVNTKDYGRSDPAPTFTKPRFKLIPN
ncbi:hypothetical protein R6Q59_019298 [Mikania micrantha]